MKSLFGLSMDTIMGWMLTMFVFVIVILAVLGLRNRLLVKLGLRNIPRRRAQTALIIFGLMLSTVIITSAFGTGDTVSYSVRATALTGLGYIDETVSRTTGNGLTGAAGSVTFLPATTVSAIQSTLAGDKDVDGVVSALVQTLPLQDLTSGQTKSGSSLLAVPANYPTAFGPLTTADGMNVTLGQLGAGEVYLNQAEADKLAAHPGDSLRLFLGNKPVAATVRAILRTENLAGGGLGSNNFTFAPTVLMPLARAQQLIGLPGAVSTILISNRGGAEPPSSLSDNVTARLRALLANPTQVAAAQTILRSPAGKAALQKLINDPAASGAKKKLQELQTEVARSGQSMQLKSLLSDPDVVDAFRAITKNPAVTRPLSDALASISDYSVTPIKKNGLAVADLFGSIFTTIFVVFGLFSIAAGVLLIFLIFVMLAAERRAEMGMARAIGTQRRHLIQQFLFEGFAYDLGAALVGMVLGILVGLGMVKIMASLFGAADFTLQSHVEPRSLVVAFCLGALVTFFTVAFSSWRVSRLNIVAAIRDLPESFGEKSSIGEIFRLPISDLARAASRISRGGWTGMLWFILRLVLTIVFYVPVSIPIIIVSAILSKLYDGGLVLGLILGEPIGLVIAFILSGAAVRAILRARPQTLLRIGFTLGAFSMLFVALWHAIIGWRVFISRGPLLVLIGFLLAKVGIANKSAFSFDLGASLLLIGLAMLLRWIMVFTPVPEAIRNRIGYSLAGLALVIFWLLPFDALNGLTGPLDGGIEMFFVSGIMLVLGGVWTVMYNADLLLGALLAIFGSRGTLAPILKTAVTYPVQHKFRTGLTLAMFSLVIFTLMVMSVLIRSTASSLDLNRDTGGYQVYGAADPNNPIQDDGRQTIAADPTLRASIAAVGGLSNIGIGVRQPGQDDQSWQPYVAQVADDAYLRSTQFTLHNRAQGYSSDSQVWQTLLTKPDYAVVDGGLVDSGGGGNGGPGSFIIHGFKYKDTTFTPQTIEVRDVRSGTVVRLTVIGVLDLNAGNLFALTTGIYTGEKTLQAKGLLPLIPTTYVFRVAPGHDVHTVALALGKAFLNHGLDVKEAQKEFDTNQSINTGLNNLLQAFMGLGLVVGIAALGVIATRSVVERRQEIGMMRAIGFKRSMIRTSFLLESSFVAILGTLLGVALGLVLARNLVNSIAKTDNSVSLHIPWTQILLIVVIAYAASLLTTYLPARQASQIYPAEALRYE